MSPVRVLKFVAAPLVWLSVYILRGLSIVGLGAYAAWTPDGNQNPEILDSPRAPTVFPSGQTASPAQLSPDEVLWEDELAADDAGTS